MTLDSNLVTQFHHPGNNTISFHWKWFCYETHMIWEEEINTENNTSSKKDEVYYFCRKHKYISKTSHMTAGNAEWKTFTDDWLRSFICRGLFLYQMPSYQRSGPVFCLMLGVNSDYAQPITGQDTEVTCPVIGWAQPELIPSRRQKTGPVVTHKQWQNSLKYFTSPMQVAWNWRKQCWKFPQVRQSEADNFGGGPGTFCWFSLNLMFMIWDSNHEDLQLFD